MTTPIKILVSIFILLDIFLIYSIWYKSTHKDKFIDNPNLKLIYRIYYIVMITLNIIGICFIIFYFLFLLFVNSFVRSS